MEDMDDVRKATGTAADFSGWNGIKAEGNFRQMKVISKEKVIDPTEEIDEEEIVEQRAPSINLPPQDIDEMKGEKKSPPKKDFKEAPGVKEAYLNPVELKNVAIKLMPTVDNIDPEKYEKISENAINLAFTFLNVWNQKVQVGGGN